MSPIRSRSRARLAAVWLCLAVLAPLEARADGELRVLAAASLTEVVTALAAEFSEARVVASFGSSSELARQIADGAPADVFVSASPEWVDFLRERTALAGEAVVFASNTLVCIAPKGERRAAQARDLASLFSAFLAPDDLVAIADAGVPAGEYARQSLSAAGLLEPNRKRLVGRKDVRAVLHSVESGETRAGFVYATDARTANVELLFELEASSHAPIVYLAAVVRSSARPEAARRFAEFLRSPQARALLARAGFVVR